MEFILAAHVRRLKPLLEKFTLAERLSRLDLWVYLEVALSGVRRNRRTFLLTLRPSVATAVLSATTRAFVFLNDILIKIYWQQQMTVESHSDFQ